jgi:lysophospholipase L1-like esterase
MEVVAVRVRLSQKPTQARLFALALPVAVAMSFALFLGGPSAAASLAAAASPPFTQCPAVGSDTSCGLLVTIQKDASAVVSGDPTQPVYDGSDDTLVGVQNNSHFWIGSVPVSSTTGLPLFSFDDDGLCSDGNSGAPPPTGCPFGPTGYEGPGVSFTNISDDATSGTVNFSPPIPPHGSTYFSLEDQLSTVAPYDISGGTPVSVDIDMVALGDSYSSGEGAKPFDNNKQAQQCHRGPGAWPRQLQQDVFGISTILHLACSGATIADLTQNYKGTLQVPVSAQPNLNVQLVTLTVGGNDVGFVSILRSCYVTFSSCAKVANSKSFAKSIANVQAGLPTLYGQIRADYPNALIAHVGYPRIFPAPGTTPDHCGWLSKPEQKSVEKMTKTLNDAIASSLAAYSAQSGDTNIAFEPVTDALAGHEECTKNSWMNPINISASPEGHPTLKGYTAYMKAVAKDIGLSLKPSF